MSLESLEIRHRIEEVGERFGLVIDTTSEGGLLAFTRLAHLRIDGRPLSAAAARARAEATGLTCTDLGIAFRWVGSAEPVEEALLRLLSSLYEADPEPFLELPPRGLAIPPSGALPQSTAWLERFYGGDFLPREKKPPVVDLRRSQGPFLRSVDESPLQIIDSASQIASLPGGFRADAVQAALDEGRFDEHLVASLDTRDTTQPWRERYADALRALVPPALCHVSFVSSGAEANEKALHIARKNGPGGRRVIAFEGAFHGRTLLALFATHNPAKRAASQLPGYETTFIPFPVAEDPFADPPVPTGWRETWTNPEASREPLIGDEGDPWLASEVASLCALEAEIKQGDVLAVMIEPYQCEGGDRSATLRFFHGLRALTRGHGVPLIFDEVQSGFGLSGPFFWHRRFWMIDQFGRPGCPALIVTQSVVNRLPTSNPRHRTTVALVLCLVRAASCGSTGRAALMRPRQTRTLRRMEPLRARSFVAIAAIVATTWTACSSGGRQASDYAAPEDTLGLADAKASDVDVEAADIQPDEVAYDVPQDIRGDGRHAPDSLADTPPDVYLPDDAPDSDDGEGTSPDDVVPACDGEQPTAAPSASCDTPEAQLASPGPIGGGKRARAADLDGDSFTDMVAWDEGGLTVRQATGTGAFTEAVLFTFSNVAFELADIDGNGTADLVWASASQVGVDIGIGDGTFLPKKPEKVAPLAEVDGQLIDVHLVDLNKDSAPDMVLRSVCCIGTRTNDGSGAFSPPTVTPIPGGLWSIVGADFDGDKLVDLVGPSVVGGGLVVLWGLGDGAFAPPEHVLDTTTLGASITVGDFLHQGYDQAVVGSAAEPMLIDLGPSPPLLTMLPGAFTGAAPVASGDFTGDENLDVVVAEGTSLVMVPGTTAGGFDAGSQIATFPQGFTPYSYVAGHFSSSAHLDIAVVGVTKAESWVSGATQLVLNMTPPTGFETFGSVAAGGRVVALASHDLNGDGKEDVVAGIKHPDLTSGGVSVLVSDGAGRFTVTPLDATGFVPGGLAIADVNHDELPDIIATQYLSTALDEVVCVSGFDGQATSHAYLAPGNAVSVFLGIESGFASPTSHATGHGPLDVAVAHIDGDDYLDLVVATSLSPGVSCHCPLKWGPLKCEYMPGSVTGQAPIAVLYGDGAGDFSAPVALPMGPVPSSLPSSDPATFPGEFAALRPSRLAVVDLTGDGYVDVVLGVGLSILENIPEETYPSHVAYNDVAAGLALVPGDGIGFPQGTSGMYLGPIYQANGAPTALATGRLGTDCASDLLIAVPPGIILVGGTGSLDGFGAATPLMTVDALGMAPHLAIAGDLNHDDILDVVAVTDNGDLFWTLSAPNGYAPPEKIARVGLLPKSLALGDIDGDSVPDVIVGGGDNNGTITVVFMRCEQ